MFKLEKDVVGDQPYRIVTFTLDEESAVVTRFDPKTNELVAIPLTRLEAEVLYDLMSLARYSRVGDRFLVL